MKFFLCMYALLVSALLYGQENPGKASDQRAVKDGEAPTRVLHAGATTQVSNLTTHALILPVRCDNAGTVYFRTYEPKGGPHGVVSISADGTKIVQYDVPANSSYQDATVNDFFLNTDGKVFIPAQTGKRTVLLGFSDSGKLDEETPVQDTAWIAHAAAFNKGYFVSGLTERSVKASRAGAKPDQQNYAAVLNASGRLVKPLTGLTGAGAGAQDKASSNNADGGLRQQRADFLIDSPETGLDGNVYFLDAGPNALSVLNSSGEVVHRFVLPDPGAGFKPSQLLIAQGKVAVVFLKTAAGQNDETAISVLNAGTGDEVARYAVAPDVIGIPACFDGRQFTFLGNSEGHIVLRTAQ